MSRGLPETVKPRGVTKLQMGRSLPDTAERTLSAEIFPTAGGAAEGIAKPSVPQKTTLTGIRFFTSLCNQDLMPLKERRPPPLAGRAGGRAAQGQPLHTQSPLNPS